MCIETCFEGYAWDSLTCVEMLLIETVEHEKEMAVQERCDVAGSLGLFFAVHFSE